MAEALPAGAPGAAPSSPDGWQESGLRHEIKYVGPAGWAEGARLELSRRLAPDADFPHNRVHSVYFDTPRLMAYEDKANGQYRKDKVRLRWYEPGVGDAWLEIKSRYGALGSKRRKRVRFAAPASPGALDRDALTRLVREHLGSALVPVLWLDYERHRFRAPGDGPRVALDQDVMLRWASPWLPPRRPPGPLPFFVAELKGPDPDAPGWLSRVLGRHVRRTALSKYALCVEHARGGCN